MSKRASWELVPPADACFAGDPNRKIDPYLFSAEAVTALRVALVTQRPLLVAGLPGCGKTCLAEALAAEIGWTFLCETITSRTRLEKLTVEVDHLSRLHDAQRAAAIGGACALKADEAYYRPGVFWWALDRDSASRHNLSADDARQCGICDVFPGIDRTRKAPPHGTVLLIDENDKAEPDLPNDLLEPLDRRRFRLPNGKDVSASPEHELLTVITTNRERELPQAFLRRCVSLVLDEPTPDRLVAIARKHYADANLGRVEALAAKMTGFRAKAREMGRRPPGTSEFLDAVRACEALDVRISADDPVWRQVERAVLLTPGEPESATKADSESAA